jgi:hypothetical protein
MRKKFSVHIIVGVILLSFLRLSPAEALFGLSKCEKFKKEILKYENDFNAISAELYTYKGKFLVGQAKASYDKLMNTNLLQSMWKVAYNNQNCLTNTQKDYLTVLKTFNPAQFVKIDTGIYTKKSKYCKKSLNFLKDECRFTDDDKVENVYLIGSIFDE